MGVQANAAHKSASAPDFRGQVALISNVCDDSGAGIARHLASLGAVVGLCGTKRKDVELLAGEIVSQGGQAIAAAAERTGSEHVADIVDRVRSKFGKIDILVNISGEVAGRPLAELSMGAFKNNVDSMLTTSFAFLSEVIPGMRTRRYGRIINIISLPYLGLPAQAELAAAHAGIFGLTRSVALETAADGITVNSLVKGDFVATDLSAADAEKLREPSSREAAWYGCRHLTCDQILRLGDDGIRHGTDALRLRRKERLLLDVRLTGDLSLRIADGICRQSCDRHRLRKRDGSSDGPPPR